MLLRKIITILLLGFISCNQTDNAQKNKNVEANSNNLTEIQKSNSYSYKTFAVKNGWGYDVFIKNKLIVHQPHIPAVAGNRGFTTEKQAESVALLVIDKLSKGELPPTISIEELDSLNATE